MHFLKYFVCALFFASAISSPALAGDSYYKLHINNHSQLSLVVNTDSDDCTNFNDFARGGPLYDKSIFDMGFTRDGGSCHGHNGSFNLVIFQLNNLGRGQYNLTKNGTVHLDFTADHELATYNYQSDSNFIYIVSFRPWADGDNDQITVDLYDRRSLDVNDVVALGCRTDEAIAEAVRSFVTSPVAGSATRRQAGLFSPSGLTTSSYNITAQIWGFRAVLKDIEITSLENGSIMSKDMISQAIRPQSEAAFWGSNGPKVVDNSGKDALAFRLLAAAMSQFPVSQFASVALTYDKATEFLQPPPNDFVYAFLLKPDAPIQGMKNCTLSHESNELQIQILGGTKVTNLMRRREHTTVWELKTPTGWLASQISPDNHLPL